MVRISKWHVKNTRKINRLDVLYINRAVQTKILGKQNVTYVY